VTGPVALHGGGEYREGDEAFLGALLELGQRRVGADRSIRVAVVPTAAARNRPDLAAVHGIEAFKFVADLNDLDVEVTAVGVVDRATAADTALAGQLLAADVIHFSGGDPDLIPTVMPGSAAWAAIVEAHAAGAVLAGASAGAMALGSWTWTPGGGMGGLMVVHGIVVVPHAKEATWAAIVDRFAAWAPEGLGALGLAEQTGVIDEPVAPGSSTIRWRVVGPGEARWLATPGGEMVVARSGEMISTPIVAL
jgi:cyanophycinase